MPIDYQVNNGVARATLNRPEALNAFDIPDLEELLSVFRNAKADDAVRVLVLPLPVVRSVLGQILKRWKK